MKAWREVAKPHQDVLNGEFTANTFAVDISQIAAGQGIADYQDPIRFFQRTYLTSSLRTLLGLVLRRLDGKESEPIINLQTNFGGGKTHTLLAAWHLAVHGDLVDGMEELRELRAAEGVDSFGKARAAVIDGMNLGVNQPLSTTEGLKVNTLWGRIAYDLGGAAAYRKIESSDQSGTAPGKEVLTEILREAAPCVILMDELVAYFRSLLTANEIPLAGSYENNLKFLQELTECAKTVGRVQLLVSMPESQTQLGGPGGVTAMSAIKAIVGRTNFVWRSGTAEEGYEIVKRRLFEPILDEASREETCRDYLEYYQSEPRFDTAVKKDEYLGRLRACYPIHPELFDELYDEWSTLDGFQRTRGVLQFMASVIHSLWVNENHDPMIQPGNLPFGVKSVADKCLFHLGDGWASVIDGEVDGPRAVTKRIEEDARFGSISAARRAARTIFLATAPSAKRSASKGVDLSTILLGAAVPGHVAGVYADVVKRFDESMSYFYSEDERHWYTTEKNLRKEAEDIKAHTDEATAKDAVKKIVQGEMGTSDIFDGTHVFVSEEDVPDQIGGGLRLVVLAPDCGYTPSAPTIAFDAAKRYVLWRGANNRRIYSNRLVFLAPDYHLQGTMIDNAKTALAWQKIVREIDGGARDNLNGYQRDQAKRNKTAAENALKVSVLGCYKHLLVPQQLGRDDITFTLEQVGYSDHRIANSVEIRMMDRDHVIPRWGSSLLLRHLNRWYLKDGQTEVDVRRVWEDCGKLLNWPRLVRQSVFENAIREGVRQKLFGYAQAKEGSRYEAFAFDEELLVAYVNEGALLIEAGKAAAYKAANAQPVPGPNPSGPGPVSPAPGPAQPGPTPQPTPTQYRGFYASANIDRVRGLNQLTQIWNEIVMHFIRNPDVGVEVKLDVRASSHQPFDARTMSVVKENMNQLGVTGGFEVDPLNG